MKSATRWITVALVACLTGGCWSLPHRMTGQFNAINGDFLVIKRNCDVYWSPLAKTGEKLVRVGVLSVDSRDPLAFLAITHSASQFMGTSLRFSDDGYQVRVDWKDLLAKSGNIHELRATSYMKEPHELRPASSWILRADRVLGPKGFESGPDTWVESDYRPLEEKHRYLVILSADGKEITIERQDLKAPLIRGTLIPGSKPARFDLKEGLFAGGSFSTWRKNWELLGELTVYGSGVLVASSERGRLILDTAVRSSSGR